MDEIFWLIVIAYPIIQGVAIVRTHGYWRAGAALPLLPMGYVGILVIEGANANSNLWPLMLMIASIVSVVVLALYLMIHKWIARDPESL